MSGVSTLLMGLIIPAAQKLREVANRVECPNYLPNLPVVVDAEVVAVDGRAER